MGDLIQEISLDFSRNFNLSLHKHFSFENTHLSFSASHRTDWSWQSYKHELASNQNPSASCLKRQECMKQCISFLKKGERMDFLNTYSVLPTEWDNLQSLILMIPQLYEAQLLDFQEKKIGRMDSALCVCPVNCLPLLEAAFIIPFGKSSFSLSMGFWLSSSQPLFWEVGPPARTESSEVLVWWVTWDLMWSY